MNPSLPLSPEELFVKEQVEGAWGERVAAVTGAADGTLTPAEQVEYLKALASVARWGARIAFRKAKG